MILLTVGMTFRDTLTLVLCGEWSKLPEADKARLNVSLQNTGSNLINKSASNLCQNLINLTENPWSDPSLSDIIHGNSVGESEGKLIIWNLFLSNYVLIVDLSFTAVDFCLKEMPVLLTVRLEVLCDEQCEDFALKLVANCRNCLRNPLFSEACSLAEQEIWLDFHVTLLYRQETRRSEIFPILDEYSLEDGYKLVQRLIERNEKKNGIIWRNSLKTAEFITIYLLTTALMQFPPPARLSSLAIQLVKLQESTKAVIDVFIKLVRGNKLITSSHIFILCETLSNEVK